jgi:SRSO17 transposase
LGRSPRACAATKSFATPTHYRPLPFVGVSPWSDQEVREYAAHHGISALSGRKRVTDWIVDDTGFPKQGVKSPGVQRQYGGTLGKTGNCQIAVSVTVATRTMHLPIDMDLYLPRICAEDLCRGSRALLCRAHPLRRRVSTQVAHQLGQ